MQIQRIVDLSLNLNEQTPVYPGDPIPKIEVATTIEKEGYNLFEVLLGSQSGSHIDAPYHFIDNGKRVDQFALSAFIGQGMLIDVSNKDANEEITLADIKPYLSAIKMNPFVLFRTNWDRYSQTETFFNHPYIGKEAAQALIDSGIKFLGIDTINADQTGGTVFPVHDLFAQHQLIIGENWGNFADITRDYFIVAALPLKMHCDGSPVRPVVLEVDE